MAPVGNYVLLRYVPAVARVATRTPYARSLFPLWRLWNRLRLPICAALGQAAHLASPGVSGYRGAFSSQLKDGRVAQRKSTSLTWKGSQVRSLSRPPSEDDSDLSQAMAAAKASRPAMRKPRRPSSV